MNNVFKSKGFKVLVTIVVFFLVVALVSSGNSYVNNFLTSYVLTPIQRAVTGGTNSAGDAIAPKKTYEELEEEVSRLEKENREMHDMLVDYYDIKRVNQELERFYDIKKENEDFSVLTATVIGRDPNENFYGFTLDRGSNDGVEMNDPVMTENGLVGWVSEVAPGSCKVSVILSPDASVGAVIKRTNDSGVITGSPLLSDEGLTRMINISSQSKVKEGDIVVTSGFGGVFPKNLQIGRIKEISLDEYTGMPAAVIEPFEQVRTVSAAVIVVDFKGKGEVEPQKDTSVQRSSQSSQQSSQSSARSSSQSSSQSSAQSSSQQSSEPTSESSSQDNNGT